jgi:hypothetical protein
LSQVCSPPKKPPLTRSATAKQCVTLLFVEELRIDFMFIVAVTAAAIVGLGTLKVVAMAHKDHPIAQGYLVLF